jgi:MFS transporter, DHA1 family, multidrug resistance protein
VKLTRAQKKYILVYFILNFFLLGIGVDLYVPSLPRIAAFFNVTSGLTQLSVGLYMIASGVGSLFLMFFADCLKQKKIIFASNVLFVLGSFLPVIFINIYCLFIARIMQGIAVSGLGVASRVIATDCFKGKELAKILTYFAIAWGLGPIIAPVIGSYLQYYFNWQASFIFYGIYGLILLICAYKFLPDTNPQLVSIVSGKILQNIRAVLINPIFLYGGIVLSLCYVALIVFNVLGPFLIQTSLKYSVVAYGHMAFLLGLGYFIGGLCNRILIIRFTPMKISLYAIWGCVFFSILMLLLGLLVSVNIYIILIPTALILILCGLIFPNLQAKILGSFSNPSGTVNALLGIFMAITAFLFTANAKYLSVTTQIPIAVIFGSIFLICLLLYFKVSSLTRSESDIEI